MDGQEKSDHRSHLGSKELTKNEKRYHHGDLREAIVDAVLSQIEAGGPEAVSLRAAARTVGVSPGATFKHFRDKRAVLTALAVDGFDRMNARIEVETAAAESAMDRFLAVGRGYLLWALENPARFRIMFRADLLEPNDAALVESTSRLRAALTEDLPAALPDGLDAAEVARRGLLAWGAVHGVATLAIEGQLRSGPNDPAMPPPEDLGAALAAMGPVFRSP